VKMTKITTGQKPTDWPTNYNDVSLWNNYTVYDKHALCALDTDTRKVLTLSTAEHK